MKMRISFAFAVLIAVLLLSGCSQITPHENLLGHYEKILTILNENKTDIEKAAKLAGEYVLANIADIKAQYALFEKEPSAPIVKDSVYIERQTNVVKLHADLETNYPLLMNAPQVIEALVPMREVWKNSAAPGAAAAVTPAPASGK
ncbi:MAG: hypothetical protein EHM28_01810 [Spirochaetaceae bacterium]|nr:MAG: hypothetical protein EHM28_01810 [Spirochaetaceae bacterium]